MNLDAEQQKKVEDTEHLMNVVVEMRNIYGAACIQHSQKSSIIEQQLLQLKLDSLSKTSFKSKTIPDIDVEETMRDFNEFNSELDEFCKRVEQLQHRNKNVKAVVHQMRRTNPVLAAREPLTATMLLAKAKNKNRD